MNRLPFPTVIEPDIWVDEAIWGHRLYDEQTPWMTVLEFLGILQSEMEDGRALLEETLNTLKYRPNRRLHLRNILFNNPHLEAVLEQIPYDDEAQWQTWLQQMRNTKGGPEERDYGYLRRRFSSFKALRRSCNSCKQAPSKAIATNVGRPSLSFLLGRTVCMKTSTPKGSRMTAAFLAAPASCSI
jgi:hypothetical protein